MIIDKIVQVKITNRVKTYYLNLGYDVSKNIIGVKVSDLSNGSHIKINVKCDNCLVEKKIGYKYYLSYLRNDVYYCSLCNKIHREETNRLKYGVDYFMQTDEYNLLVTKTSIKKYGVEHFTQDEIYKKRKKEIYYEKNGVEHPMHLKEIKEKIKITNLVRYGSENPSQNKDVQKKMKKTWKNKTKNEIITKNTKMEKTCFEKYGNSNPMKVIQIKDKLLKTRKEQTIIKINNNLPKDYILLSIDDDFIYEIKCNKGHIFNIDNVLYYHRKNVYNTILCTHCNPLQSFVSGKELKLLDFIEENYDGEIITSDRKILDGKEIDILLPAINLGFEFNGIYWHSSKHKEPGYHFSKSRKALEKGIKLYHIWEDIWDNNNDEIKGIILEKIKKNF